MLLPLIYFQISSCHKQILSSPRKKEKYGTPYGYFVHANILPFVKYSLFWTLLLCGARAQLLPWCVALRSFSTSRHGATLLASLESQLSDSAALRYLRRRSPCERRCGGGKSFLLHAKRKIRNTPMGIPYFWRRRKDLNLRAGYPTYTLSRGASSPLEYFSI